MITREEITRLARARGLAPWQEEKRYVQAVVLHALRKERLTVKGGTYLWFFHGLDRFSEDLDFTVTGQVDRGTIEACTETLGLFGMAARAKVIKDDRFTLSFRVDARGPLYTGERSDCRVMVEASRRERVLLRPVGVRLDEAGYLLPIDLLTGMSLEEVAAEKAGALLRRGEARDLYDLWFLLKRKGVLLDRDLVDRKLAFYHQVLTPQAMTRAIGGVEKAWPQGVEPLVFGEVPDFDAVRAVLVRALGPERSRAP